MSQRGIRQWPKALMAATGVIVLLTAGCDCQQQVETLQSQNETLTLRIEELESLLQRSEASAMAAIARAEAQPPAMAARPTAPTGARPQAAQTPTQTPADGAQAQGGRTVYTVVEGDNLWNIARRKLGRGIRYKEILDLNPSVDTDEPLAIGTKLILPAR